MGGGGGVAGDSGSDSESEEEDESGDSERDSPKETKRPRGPTPYGKMWDAVTGAWVENTTVARDEEELEDSEEGEEGNAGYANKYTYQSSWKTVLPWLMCIAVVGVVCTTESGTACVGCPTCARLTCSLCVERGKTNAYTAGGSTSFKKSSVNNHKNLWHEEDMCPTQKSNDTLALLPILSTHLLPPQHITTLHPAPQHRYGRGGANHGRTFPRTNHRDHEERVSNSTAHAVCA